MITQGPHYLGQCPQFPIVFEKNPIKTNDPATPSLAHAPVYFTFLVLFKCSSGKVGFKIFTGAAKNWLRSCQSFER